MQDPLTLSQALAQRVRELQARERWTQRDLAKKLGVSQAAVNKLLMGARREGELEFYDRLARAFDLPLSELIADLEVRVAAGGGPLRRPAALPPEKQDLLAATLRQLEECVTTHKRLLSEHRRAVNRMRREQPAYTPEGEEPPETPLPTAPPRKRVKPKPPR